MGEGTRMHARSATHAHVRSATHEYARSSTQAHTAYTVRWGLYGGRVTMATVAASA